MTLLSTLAPSLAPLSSPPSKIGGASNGRAHGPAVLAVERAHFLRDRLQEQPRPAQGRPDGAPRPDVQDQAAQRAGSRSLILRRERDARPQYHSEPPASDAQLSGGNFSAAFLAQVFEQDFGPLQDFIPEHRDAAVRGSEAYRQAGAAPPAYSQDPALFRFAI